MSRYSNLQHHLQNLREHEWRASFSEIESVLGLPLPASAYKHQAWWANTRDSHVQTSAWIDVGWKTMNLDLPKRQVTFVRYKTAGRDNLPVSGNTVGLSPPSKTASLEGITISQAKAGLAKTFAVPIDCIEITIKG